MSKNFNYCIKNLIDFNNIRRCVGLEPNDSPF